MRVLITGGTGYLGAELIRQAVAGGWDVAATHFSRRPKVAGVRWLPLDIRDAAAVEREFAALRPDLVIHTAYRQSGPELWPTTAVGAGAVARAAHRASARLIHLSSDALFDGERTGRYTEQDDPSPITPYGEAKAAAERLVADQHPTALIVRTSLIYGGATPSAHEQLVLDAAAGRAELAFFTGERPGGGAVGAGGARPGRTAARRRPRDSQPLRFRPRGGAGLWRRGWPPARRLERPERRAAAAQLCDG